MKNFDDVTICIKSFEREACINRIISQLRSYGCTMRIIVADDSHNPITIIGADTLLKLPFNVGLSAGRNRMVEAVDTKYFILLDDDNTIYSKTNFELMYNTISTTSFNIVGGQMGRRWFNGVVAIDEDNRMFEYHTAWRAVEEGHKVIDYCDNFFMAETQTVLDNPWDESIKIAWEHIDFFVQGKASGDFKVCRVRSYVGDDQVVIPKDKRGFYNKYRYKRELNKQLFYAKWNLDKVYADKQAILRPIHTLRVDGRL